MKFIKLLKFINNDATHLLEDKLQLMKDILCLHMSEKEKGLYERRYKEDV